MAILGNIGGLTLTPGLYKWTSALIIPSNVVISGSSTDSACQLFKSHHKSSLRVKPSPAWIFQVSGTVVMSNAKQITLAGGALASNIVWVVAGAITVGTTSHFEGILLGSTGITFQTGSSIKGRLLSQTAVALQQTTVDSPWYHSFCCFALVPHRWWQRMFSRSKY